MKRHSLFLLLPIFLTIHLNLLGGSRFQSNSIHAQEANQAIGKDTFEIDFPGGTIDEYVQFLRTCPNFDDQGQAIPVNILVNENAKNFRLPEIRVTTNMDGALGLLQSCNSENSEVAVDQASVGDITTIQIFNDESPSVTVINAKALLLNMEEKDLLEVIDVGLGMQGNTSSVELKLHQQTGLLFAKGTRRATQLVHEIVNELAGNYRNPTRGGGGFGGGMGAPGGGGMGFGGPGMGAGGGGKFSGGGPQPNSEPEKPQESPPKQNK